MALTIWCVTVVLGSLWLWGLPVAWLVKGRHQLTGADFLLAPFLGIAAILVVFQNLVYLNIPLAQAAPFGWAAIAVAWLLFCRSGDARASMRQCPWVILVASLLVYVVQGLALFATGAHEYSGRAWTDQFNYVAWAQFLKDQPFHLAWEELGNRPYLATGLLLRWERLGQSVLHGFFSVSAFQDTRTLFGPTILLSPTLTVLAMVLLARRLGLARLPALLVGLAAGLSPALAQLHLECFLSHCLGLPLLLAFLVVVTRLGEHDGRSCLWTAVLLFLAATSVYTEFWIILQALVLLTGALYFRHCHSRKSLLRRFAALSVLALLLNPGVLGCFPSILQRLNLQMSSTLYPWAQSAEGLIRLWTGELLAIPSKHLQRAVRVLGLTATALGYLGLFKAWLHHASWGRTESLLHGRRVLGSCVFAVALLPLVVLLKDDQHSYQFYKLLVSISPLLVLGLALFWQPAPAIRRQAPRRWWPAVLACGTLLVLLVAEATGTVQMVADTNPTTPHPRSNAPLLLADDMRQARKLLEDSAPTNLLLVTNGTHGPLYNSWLSYFGRQHQIWLASPAVVDMEFTQSFPAYSIKRPSPSLLKKLPSGGFVHERPLPCALNLKSLPPGVLVLEQSDPAFQSIVHGDATDLWHGSVFRLWTSASGHWALPVHLETSYGIEHADGRPFFWMGAGETDLEVLANCAGTVTLSAAFAMGPDLDSSSGCTLRVRTSGGGQFEVPILCGPNTLTIPVQAGRTTVSLTPLGKIVANPHPNGDPRMLLLLVDGLAFTFAPGQR
jgi:hypothetical protein